MTQPVSILWTASSSPYPAPIFRSMRAKMVQPNSHPYDSRSARWVGNAMSTCMPLKHTRRGRRIYTGCPIHVPLNSPIHKANCVRFGGINISPLIVFIVDTSSTQGFVATSVCILETPNMLMIFSIHPCLLPKLSSVRPA